MSSSKISPILPLSIGAVFIATAAIGLVLSLTRDGDGEAVDSLSKNKYDYIWKNILDSLVSRNIEIWDYEEMNTDTFNFNWFTDDTHSSYDGAKAFTNIIKNRLKEN